MWFFKFQHRWVEEVFAKVKTKFLLNHDSSEWQFRSEEEMHEVEGWLNGACNNL